MTLNIPVIRPTRKATPMRSLLFLAALSLAACDPDVPAMTRGDAIDEYAATACEWLVACDPRGDRNYDACIERMRTGFCGGDERCFDEYTETDRLDACVSMHAVGTWACSMYPRMPAECVGLF